MNPWRLDYTTALSRWDTDGIVAALADDVVIRVAVHDATMQGKDIASFLFGVLSEELGALEPTGEIIEGRRAVILFDTSIGDRAAQGLNVIELDDADQIRDVTVFFRPLDALGAIADAVGARMAARFGPPPQ
jgi:hypothetical protein